MKKLFAFLVVVVSAGPAPAQDEKAPFVVTREGLPAGAVARIDRTVPRPSESFGAVSDLSLAVGGRFVAVTHDEGRPRLRVWDVQTGKLVREAALGSYDSHAFSRDGRFAFLVRDKLLVAERPQDDRPREFEKPTHHQYFRLRFGPDGKTLYLTSVDGVLRWDVSSGKRLPSSGQYKLWSRSLEFSPDGRWLALDERDRVVQVEPATGECRATLLDPIGRETIWQTYAFATPARLLVAEAYRPAVRLLDLSSGNEVFRWEWEIEFSNLRCGLSPLNGPVGVPPHGQMAVMTPQGGRAALLKVDNVAAQSNLLRLIDLATGQIRHEIDPGLGIDLVLALSPDGRYLASGGPRGSVVVWDLYGLCPPDRRPPMSVTWERLADADATQAYAAMCVLVQEPERGLQILRRHLSPARYTSAASEVPDLLAKLESAAYAVRQPAFQKLLRLRREALPALAAALPKARTLEARRRIEQLMQAASADTAEDIRARRALEVLEAMQHSGALRLLQALAAGEPGLFPTREAGAALERIEAPCAP